MARSAVSVSSLGAALSRKASRLRVLAGAIGAQRAGSPMARWFVVLNADHADGAGR